MGGGGGRCCDGGAICEVCSIQLFIIHCKLFIAKGGCEDRKLSDCVAVEILRHYHYGHIHFLFEKTTKLILQDEN